MKCVMSDCFNVDVYQIGFMLVQGGRISKFLILQNE